MLEKTHNDNSKQLMQKILIYIDTVLSNATESDTEKVNKILVSGILNVRDALFSEVVRDNQISQLNKIMIEQSAKKNQKENQEDLNQETELVKDQQV